MANMHDSFIEFDKKLKLSSNQEEEIRNSRKANRDAIRAWMAKHDKGDVRFSMQGSFPMSTTIAPLENDEYDIDDGVYLCAYKDTEKEGWPACSTVHGWIKSATEGRTKEDPIDKDACIRVSYAHGYHVDIPIYIMKDNHAYLARKSTNWEINDAKEFKEWLDEKNPSDGQLKRLIRYLKRWKDNRDVDIKGIALTIIVAENFDGAPKRDDDSLRYTVERICDTLDNSFSCIKPLTPYDDLFDRYSDDEATSIIDSFKDLLASLDLAHRADSAHEASMILRNEFGEDFPESSDRSTAKASIVSTSAAGILNRDERFG